MKMHKVFAAARKVIASVLSASVALALSPLGALADEGASGTGTIASVSVACAHGWTLNCEVSDGQAQVVSYAFTGSGTADLAVPESVKLGNVDIPIVSIGSKAFANCGNLAHVTLPDSLAYIEEYALYKTSARSVSIGTGLVYIEDYGLAYNGSLTSVTFAKGAHPEYFSVGAFSHDSQLVELEIPGLQGYEHQVSWYSGYRIAKECFNDCTSLERIVYDPDADDASTYYYLNLYSIYTNDKKLMLVTCLPLTMQATNVNDRNVTAAYAVYFYASKEASEQDSARKSYESFVLLPRGTNLMDISAGTLGEGDYYDASQDASAITKEAATSVPTLESVGRSSKDMAWGFSNYAFKSSSSTLDTVLCAFPVDRGDMGYAYVSSPEIREYNSHSGMGTSSSDRGKECFHRLRDNGTTDISSMEVHAVDGGIVDSSKYTFTFRKQVSTGGTNAYDSNYAYFDDVAQVNTAGTYGISAVGVGSHRNSSTEYTAFYVKRYDGTLIDCTSGALVDDNGQIAYKISPLVQANRFVVMAPDSDWQASVMATALAGAGEALAVFSNGTSEGSEMFQAIALAKVDYLVFIGSKEAISKQAIDRAKLLYTSGTGASSQVDVSGSDYDSSMDSYASALACHVYETFKKAGRRLDDPFAWGTTAILMSGKDGSNATAIAQYAYLTGSPVFFTNDKGELSSRTKADLADFENVVVAGSQDEVSASCFDEAAACVASATATRIMTSCDAYANSIELAEALQAGSGLPGLMGTTGTKVMCIADAVNPSCVCASAQYAALRGATLLTCMGSIEYKHAEQYMLDAGPDDISVVSLVGPLRSVGMSAAQRAQSIWYVNDKASTDIESGDSFASGSVVYSMNSDGTATAVGAANATGTEARVAASVSYGGTTFGVTAIGPSAFSNNRRLKNLSFEDGCAVAEIPAKAFSECTSLTAFAVPATVTSIGVQAFSGCSSLPSITVPAAVTKIGKGAFSGCGKLRTVSFASKSKLASIPAEAFAGCTNLKTAKVPAAVTSIGASAFEGCSALANMVLPSKLKTVGSRAFLGTGLKNVTLPTKTTTLGPYSFASCKALSVFTTGTALKKIGARAFGNCTKLKTLNVKTSKLTKSGVKNSLKKSSVNTVKLSNSAAKKKLKKYKTYFKKANCGKQVSVKG